MALQNQLYSVLSLEKSEGKITAQISLNPQHSIYEGHFPNNPVTPGVVEMEIVKEILGLGLEKNVGLKSASSVKFLAVMNPTTAHTLHVNITILETVENEIKINCQIVDDNTSYLKLAASYFLL